MDRLIKLIKEKISSLTINFGIDTNTGAPVATPVFGNADKKPAIDEIFNLLETLSKKKKLAVAFDEFQEISKYTGKFFEKNIRKSIQWHNNISYIFSGSQKHILSEMFLDSKRAFYKLAASCPLKKIDTEDYIEWIQKLYKKDKRKISVSFIENIVNLCENHPMYIQEFFFYLWDKKGKIDFNLLDQIYLKIIKNRESEFINLWDSLTLNQKKTLKIIVKTDGKNMFSAKNLVLVDLKTASQIVKALEILNKKGIISKNGKYFISDPVFKKWITG